MIPPQNCPYKELSAAPCWNCPNHIADTNQCSLECTLANITAITQSSTGFAANAQTYVERFRDYEKRREELLKLSKEALVDLIIKKPTYY